MSIYLHGKTYIKNPVDGILTVGEVDGSSVVGKWSMVGFGGDE